MLSVAIVAVVFSATPAGRVASFGFRAVGVDDQKAQFFAGDFALKLQAASGVSVVTPEEVSSVVGLERQRQLLGCAEAANSCLAELAGGLGAKAILLGTVARVGDAWAITVKLVDATNATVIGARSGQVEKESEVLSWLADAAQALAPPLQALIDPSRSANPVGVSATGSDGPKSRWWIPALSGGVLVVGGAVLFAVAHGTVSSVAMGDPSITNVDLLNDALSRARSLQTAAVVTWCVGAAAGLTAAALWFFGGSGNSNVLVSGFFTPNASGVALGGVW